MESNASPHRSNAGPDRQLGPALFGQNLTDTNKVVMPPIGVLLVPVSMQPRAIGIGLRYNY